MKKVFILLFAIVVKSFAGIQPITEVFEPAGEYSKDKYMKVAVIQWNPTGSADINATLDEAEAYKQSNREEMAKRIYLAAKKDATYIVLSEFAVIGYPDIPELSSEEDNYRNRDDIKTLVETVPGRSTEYFAKIAKQLKVYIQFGLAEVDSQTNNYHNTAVVVGPSGDIVAKYRKQHLFQIEDQYLVPGEQNVTFETPAGLIGLIICSDVYAYDVLEKYKNSKVDVISLSTSWAQYNSGMNYFKRAAIRTGAYMLAANQTYFPDSGVINPDGTTQSWIRQSEDSIAFGYLPLKSPVEAKQKLKRGPRRR